MNRLIIKACFLLCDLLKGISTMVLYAHGLILDTLKRRIDRL